MELKDIPLVSERIKSNIQKVIIGKDRTIDFILTAIISGGHVLLEDTVYTGSAAFRYNGTEYF